MHFEPHASMQTFIICLVLEAIDLKVINLLFEKHLLKRQGETNQPEVNQHFPKTFVLPVFYSIRSVTLSIK